jgi:hypothetical protein
MCRAFVVGTASLNVTKRNYAMTSHLSNRTVHVDCKDPSSLFLHYQSEAWLWINYCLKKCPINVYLRLFNCMHVLRGNLMVLLQFFWDRTNYKQITIWIRNGCVRTLHMDFALFFNKFSLWHFRLIIISLKCHNENLFGK